MVSSPRCKRDVSAVVVRVHLPSRPGRCCSLRGMRRRPEPIVESDREVGLPTPAEPGSASAARPASRCSDRTKNEATQRAYSTMNAKNATTPRVVEVVGNRRGSYPRVACSSRARRTNIGPMGESGRPHLPVKEETAGSNPVGTARGEVAGSSPAQLRKGQVAQWKSALR